MADRQTKIMNAYNAVKNGMSARAASKEFGIARSTLRDKLSHKSPLVIKPKTALTTEEEAKFSEWVINMARAGFGRTRKDFCIKIQAFLNQLHEPELRFKNNNLPGKTWYYDYLKRHPELTERNARALGFESESEMAIVTPAKVEAWFDGLKAYVEATDSSLLREPARWYNCDEFGFALCLKTKKVMSPKAIRGDRHLYINTSSSKQQITTLCCMSATGHFMSPMVVLPGKRLTTNVAKDFKECAVGLSVKGWMTGELFVNWLEKVFLPELDKRMVRRPVLLFLDGSSAHKNLKASDICLKNGVILYCLQANATHLLQPLDLSFFGSLESHWADAVMDFQVKNPGMCVTKSSFGLVFKTAYEKSCRADVARAGFEKAGLFPLSKNASPGPAPSMNEKLRVLESCMSEEQRMMYERTLEEGYDLVNDTLYNAWKICKMSVSVCISIPSTTPSELPVCPPSTSTSAHPSSDLPVCPPSTSIDPVRRELFSPHRSMDLDSFLSSSTPRAPGKKRRRREFLPNMVLTSPEECILYFAEQEESKIVEEIKKEKRARKREEKNKAKEEKKLHKNKGKGKSNVTKKGKKGGKRKRTESESSVDD